MPPRERAKLDEPVVSVIIPAYESHATLANCLEAIREQAFENFEVIVVDSGPSEKGAEIIRDRFPWVRFERASHRLLPHAARNRGSSLARSAILVFTDPDVYPNEKWLARLYGTYLQVGGIIVGSVLCHGRRWLDRGVHLSKFDMWLPGGGIRRVAIAPTVNLLCPRRVLEAVGGFPGGFMIGDTVLSWRVAEAGYSITFDPMAVLEHHHVSTWGGLLRERFSRGAEFARVRAETEAWSRPRAAWQLAVSVLPLRWAHLVLRTLREASAAGLLGDFLLTCPIVMSGHAAWLTGECRALVDALKQHARE